MKRERQIELSALMDGELEDHEISALFNASSGLERQDHWDRYTMIGDCMRKEPHISRDLTPDIMAKIREEPVVLAPTMSRSRTLRHPALALAASLAGVAVVGWLAWTGIGKETGPMASPLAVLPAPSFSVARNSSQDSLSPTNTPIARRGDFSEYLVAHSIQSSPFRIGEAARHVQTVSMTTAP